MPTQPVGEPRSPPMPSLERKERMCFMVSGFALMLLGVLAIAHLSTASMTSILTIPALQEILHFAPLSLAQLVMVISTGAMLLLLFELTKSLKRLTACWMGMWPIRTTNR